MGKVMIPESDSINFGEFKEGNSVQVRVVVTDSEAREYEKGKTVKVDHQGQEATGKIVSDPLVINENKQSGKKTLSLIIEKV
jgi:hypothetical protein